MQFKGIIFDKDGTLFDYYRVWEPVFSRHADRMLEEFGRTGDTGLRRKFLNILGMTDTGINPDGLIFSHNGVTMLARLFVFSLQHHLPYRRLIQLLTQGYYDSKEDLQHSLVASGERQRLLPLFKALKEAGYVIAVVTSDNKESTQVCLDHYQLNEYIDMISTYDDHFKSKPHPESFRAFCSKFSLKPEEVVMVGDAPVDMKYAKNSNAGYTIGVMTGSGNRIGLEKHADVIYETILDLLKDPKLELRPVNGS
jgi:phosphoglycolate phosphatase